MTPTTAPTPTVPPPPAALDAAGPRMVVLDVDGTLTADRAKEIPAGTIAAVDAARQAGHQVVLASGRSLAGLLPIARQLRLPGWFAASNGAVIARPSPSAPGFVLDEDHVQTLDVDQVLVAALNERRLSGLQIAVEKIGQGYRVNQRFPDGLLNGGQVVLTLSQLQALSSPRVALRARGVHLLIKPLQVIGLTATPAGPDWIDVTPGGVSKATALETIRKRLGITPSHTVAVGDGENDLPMLAWAARGVAMGHASERVRAAADEVTGTLDQGGAAAVLRSLTPPDGGLARQIHTAVEQWRAQEPSPRTRLSIRARRHAIGPVLGACELCAADDGPWWRVAELTAGAGASLSDVELAVVAAGYLPRLTQDGQPRPAWRFDGNGKIYTLDLVVER